MPLPSGARLGPYEILSALGAGGMGEVYRARDARLGRDVAVKVLHAGMSTDADRLRRFEQEARAAAALNHPNILAVHDLGSYEQAPYIVSELLEGRSLRELLRGGPVPSRKAIDYAIQLASGLAAAHEKGIVHRDLKPENVFITADARVKILDFGLAKLIEPEFPAAPGSGVTTAAPETLPGAVLGTIGYMAPEQVRGLSSDQRADIFAFGAILYEMLCGHRAFRGDTAADTMMVILRDDPADLSAADTNVPPLLVRIVDRCLEKSASARFQSASDVAFALSAVSAVNAPVAAPAGRFGADRLISSVVAASTTRAFCAKYFDSVNRHDAAELAEAYADDAVLLSPLFGTKHGRQAIQASWSQAFHGLRDMTATVDDVLVNGDRVCAVASLNGVSAGNAPGGPAGALRARIAFVFQLREGKIAHEERFYDQDTFLKQMGVQ